MRVDKTKKRVSFHGEEGDQLDVYYSNRGEPYREGIAFHLHDADYTEADSYIFIESQEAIELRDLLVQLYPIDHPK